MEAHGELGLGNDVDSTSLQVIESLVKERATDLSCGLIHSGVVLMNGSLAMFGFGGYGELGSGERFHKLPNHLKKLQW